MKARRCLDSSTSKSVVCRKNNNARTAGVRVFVTRWLGPRRHQKHNPTTTQEDKMKFVSTQECQRRCDVSHIRMKKCRNPFSSWKNMLTVDTRVDAAGPWRKYWFVGDMTKRTSGDTTNQTQWKWCSFFFRQRSINPPLHRDPQSMLCGQATHVSVTPHSNSSQ